MELYNTAFPAQKVGLQEAVLQSLAPGKGLYMPSIIPTLPSTFFDQIEQHSFQSIGYEVCKSLLQGVISDDDLRTIIDRAFDFEPQLVSLNDRIFSLELWHGPSLAFKDFGARFMAALMSYFVTNTNQTLTILVATSGDTGGAVAYGFLDVPNIEVVILYPKGKVTNLQEKQLTTLGSNIIACEIDGSFDDCQSLVKEAFMDESLKGSYYLSSANSINIARLIPQAFYYFEAFKQMKKLDRKIVCSVPSGNFGNLTAGLIACKMGLGIDHFIAATNVNKIVPEYLSSGLFEPKPSIATLSNAMDVGNPSNFVRMQELFHYDVKAMRQLISGAYYSDAETVEEMQYIYSAYGYISEPHGAIGHKALRTYLDDHDDAIGFFLETAHPAKFVDSVNEVLGIEVDIPSRLAILADRQKISTPLSNDYGVFKQFLLDRLY